jgi:hypothetical protein
LGASVDLITMADPLVPCTTHRGRASISTMATRDELKALIDLLPEPRLEIVRNMLARHLHPPQRRPPEIEQLHRWSREYREEIDASTEARPSVVPRCYSSVPVPILFIRLPQAKAFEVKMAYPGMALM